MLNWLKKKLLRIEGYRYLEDNGDGFYTVELSQFPPKAAAENDYKNVVRVYSFLPGDLDAE